MNNSDIQKLTELVKNIVGYMNVPCDVAVGVSEDLATPITVSIATTDNARFLIGKNGQNLNALEHVIRAAWSRGPEARSISVDVNDYRRTRITQLTEAVRQAASRVRDTRKPEVLPPMSSYERRIVHTELASWTEIATESIGQDSQRRVVIKPL